VLLVQLEGDASSKFLAAIETHQTDLILFSLESGPATTESHQKISKAISIHVEWTHSPCSPAPRVGVGQGSFSLQAEALDIDVSHVHCVRAENDQSQHPPVAVVSATGAQPVGKLDLDIQPQRLGCG
jgi:hypothetical protein